MDELKPCPRYDPLTGGETPFSRYSTEGLIKEARSVLSETQIKVWFRHDFIAEIVSRLERLNRRAEPENKPLCEENENFIQNKFGYCFYTLDSSPLIYNLYVHPQYRRRRHSKALLELVIREIRKRGYEGEIRIQVKPKEDSIKLVDLIKYYQSMGLVIYEARKPEEEK